MVEMLLSAFVHSFVIMTIAVVAVMDLDVAATGSYYSFGFMVFSWVVLTMNYRATFITTTYNFVFLAALAVSFLTYLLFACVYCSLPSMFPEVHLGRQLWQSFLARPSLCSARLWINSCKHRDVAVVVRYGSEARNVRIEPQQLCRKARGMELSSTWFGIRSSGWEVSQYRCLP